MVVSMRHACGMRMRLRWETVLLLIECVDKKFGRGSIATNEQSIRRKINHHVQEESEQAGRSGQQRVQ